MMINNTYTVLEIAEVLDLTPQTVRRYIKEKKLLAAQDVKPLIITEESLKEFLKVGYSPTSIKITLQK